MSLSRHSMQGFSLVEIMIAMTLGVMLLGGTITIFASSKDGYRLQENVAGLQENARFAIHAMRRDIEMAGFPRILDISPFIVTGDTPGGSIQVTSNGGTNLSDTITVQFQSNNPVPANPMIAPTNKDCLGAEIDDGNPIINQYFISNNELRCRGIGNETPQTLVENVDNLQALYGIDSDDDGIANLYVTATEVEDGAISAGTPDWPQVVSLRLALLVASESNTSSPQNQSFTLLDAPAINKNDGRMYRVFSTTIPLRNRIP